MALNPPHIPSYNPALDLSWVTGDPGGDWYNAPPRVIVPADGPPIRAEVVVQEESSDDLEITQHPVEQGAVIHDHAFKRPAELQVGMGWGSQYAGDLRALYGQILNLQASRTPFQVWTGKRTYSNMVVASLRTMTDASMEFTFMADISFREVILVNTSIVVTGAIYNSNNLQNPDITIATQPSGQQQAVPFNIDMTPDQLQTYMTPTNVPRLTPIAQ